MPQCWPLCYWVAVVVDHFSRESMGSALFRRQPTSEEVTEALDKVIDSSGISAKKLRRSGRAVEKTGKTPKHIISDKGRQFDCGNYKTWCEENNIKPRFGAVGKHGSIAITERFIKTLKYEYTKLISVPLHFDDMRHELTLFFTWYNEYRDGRTPNEVRCTTTCLSCRAKP